MPANNVHFAIYRQASFHSMSGFAAAALLHHHSPTVLPWERRQNGELDFSALDSQKAGGLLSGRGS